jgi:hypothetical protein
VDIDYPSDVEAFCAEVRGVIAANTPLGWRGLGSIDSRDEADEFVARWRAVLFAHRLLGITWPKRYGGRALSKLHQVALTEELARAGLPAGGHNDYFSVKMIGNTILRWGTDEQKDHFLPRALSGEHRWCQGYSEPEAGSDLASLRTTARREGEGWVLSGQKTWTTQAHRANWIFVLARTDPASHRAAGLTLLLVPMEQERVVVRPIRSATGEHEFNEVFLDGAETAAGNVVGAVGEGWTVAQTLLGFERGDEAATNPILFRAEYDRLVDLAAESGVLDDTMVADGLARLRVEVEVMRFLGYRILTRYLDGEPPGPESSVSKLYWSEYHQRAATFALDLLGPRALVLDGRAPLRPVRTDDPDAPNSTASWVGAYLNSRAGTIYAGTSEVQRNILAERVLGLPREGRGGSPSDPG